MNVPATVISVAVASFAGVHANGGAGSGATGFGRARDAVVGVVGPTVIHDGRDGLGRDGGGPFCWSRIHEKGGKG